MKIEFVNDWKEEYFQILGFTFGNLFGIKRYFSIVFFGIGLQITIAVNKQANTER